MTGYVYAVQALEGGPVKIGYTADLKQRLAQLQSAHHCELTIVDSFHGEPRHEANLHTDLAARCIRGEWFEDCDETWFWFRASRVAVATQGLFIEAAREMAERMRDPVSCLEPGVLAGIFERFGRVAEESSRALCEAAAVLGKSGSADDLSEVAA